jgi:hypothetical protein
MGFQRGFPTLGDEAFPGHLFVNQRLEKFMEEGGKVYGVMIVGTHLIPACMDHGIPEVHAAGLLAMMGIFDLVGTTASGWLSDRYSNRWLLFTYYGLRGLSLLFLPQAFDPTTHRLPIFAVFYGLDWIATVPPTVALIAKIFGRRDIGLIFGWVVAAHQIGRRCRRLPGRIYPEHGGQLRSRLCTFRYGLHRCRIRSAINRKGLEREISPTVCRSVALGETTSRLLCRSPQKKRDPCIRKGRFSLLEQEEGGA